MRGDTVQILAHMHSRILSFETGVMIGCSNSRGKPVAQGLAGFMTLIDQLNQVNRWTDLVWRPRGATCHETKKNI